MTNISAYPLTWPEGWPRARNRKRALFGNNKRVTSAGNPDAWWMSKERLSIADATDRIVTELRRLGVRQGESIISSNLTLRLDGKPRSDQREPLDPGVAVYWRKDERSPMRVMAIDIYDRVADNLAAIAATLFAMRAIERHGGAQILERAFTGFTAIAPPRSPWEILGIEPGTMLQRDEAERRIQWAFRNLARQHHPDAGGDVERFKEATRARDEALRLIGAKS